MPQSKRFNLLAGIPALACLALHSIAALSQTRVGNGNPVDQLPKLEVPAKPTVTVDVEPGAPPQARTDRVVTIKKIAIEGVRSVPFDLIQAVFLPFIGKTVSVAELVEAAKQVAPIYQAAGYALAFGFIPEQDLAGGNVRIVVVEGYVKRVTIDGNAGGSESAILRVAEPLTSEQPLRADSFARMVALLGRVPGVAIEATVPPPTTTDGATDLILKVTRKPITLSSSLDTYRPGARVLATVTGNGLTELGGQTSASALVSQDSSDEKFFALGQSIPVGSDGLILRLDVYHYSSDSVFIQAPSVSGIDEQSGSRISLSGSLPLVLALDHQLIGNLGLDAAHSSDGYGGQAGTVLKDQRSDLRIVHVGISASAVLAPMQASASADLYHGLNALGASETSAMVDDNFTRLVLALTDKLSYTDSLSSTFSMRGQYSRNRLASSEQIGFGGAQFGLGYPVSDVVGDRGWGVSADFGRIFLVALPGVRSIEPYLEVDTARVYSNLLSQSPARLASVAIGARLSDAHHYNVDFAVARPIGAVPTDGSGRALRFDMNFSYRTD